MMFWIAVILGIVEGLTEFLPISSTGHLIVTNDLLGFEGERSKIFAIVIQLGAILSVVWEFRERLFKVVRDLPTKPEARRFSLALFVAFLPAAIIGLLVHDFIKEHLFSVKTVAMALIAGAILILIVESLPLKVRTKKAENISLLQAFGVGFAQCLSLWSGFSRSAATILGGLVCGLERRAATEFSFFLAIPIMFAATLYDLLKDYEHLAPGDFGWLALSFAVSFVVAWASIRWLLKFVSSHSFKPFAIYRLIAGTALLIYAW